MDRVAALLEVSNHVVWRWEDGRTAPMLDRLYDLGNIYGVSVDWLLGRDVEGDGKITLSQKEQELVAGYRLLEIVDRDMLDEIVERLQRPEGRVGAGDKVTS